MLLLMTLGLTVSSICLGWALSAGYYHLSIILGILVLIQIFLLFQRLSKTLREVLFFFKALKNDDTSVHYSSHRSNHLMAELGHYLNELNKNFSQMKVDHDLREQYFMRILENLSGGLLVVTKTGHVNHINPRALSLFDLPNMTHIKALKGIDAELYELVSNLRPGKKGEISLKPKEKMGKMQLDLQCTGLNLQGEDVRIITVQDLSVEMEQKEIENWIRLIRVMSHEIMNSLAPITSISTTLKSLWAEGTKESSSMDDNILRTIKGLDAIAEQSEGLTTFFESYRILSRIPDPVLKDFSVCTMFEKVETLVKHYPENKNISISFTCNDASAHILADEQMIIQVLLNLIKNAAQALEGKKDASIDVSARQEKEGMQLIVMDNGPGISAEIANDIFLPFFTTREKGTGVGLSYSRQVMHLNGGNINFESSKNQTMFRLSFPT